MAVQGKACGAAATNIVNKCVRVRQGALADDTTVVVIDCKPHNIASFKGYVPDLSKREGSISVKVCFPNTGPVAGLFATLFFEPCARVAFCGLRHRWQ